MIRISEVAYRLELSSTFRLHSMFHIIVLKKKVGNLSLILSDLPMYDTKRAHVATTFNSSPIL